MFFKFCSVEADAFYGWWLKFAILLGKLQISDRRLPICGEGGSVINLWEIYDFAAVFNFWKAWESKIAILPLKLDISSKHMGQQKCEKNVIYKVKIARLDQLKNTN